jgi:hypothetical protein
VVRRGRPTTRVYGNLLLRVIDHYGYRTGEAMAIRQQLGHTRLPSSAATSTTGAPYRPGSG